MKRLLGRILIGVLCTGLFSASLPAQAEDIPPFDARGTIGTILVGGLVGGILGLSTLSFYAKPQDNIRNITIGAGTGMIVSALYLTFNLASNPKSVGSTLVPLWDAQMAGLAFQHRF